MTTDFLSTDLSEVPIIATPRPSYGVWFDGPTFWSYLNKTASTYVDIMTFSTGDNPLDVPIRRLIIGDPGRRFSPKVIPRTLEGYKRFSNLHAKMVVAHGGPMTRPEVYVGSLNFCDSTSAELIVRVEESLQAKTLIAYFDNLWNNSTHIKHNKK